MSLKSFIRNIFIKRLNSKSRTASYKGFDQIKSMGFVFVEGKNSKEIIEFTKSFEQQGKQMHLLGYIPLKRKAIEREPSFPWFCKSNLNWIGFPKGSEIEVFTNSSLDVYFNLSQDDSIPLNFIDKKVNAKFKIGTRGDGFDLKIKPKDGDIKNTFQEIEYYLNFINQKENEAV